MEQPQIHEEHRPAYEASLRRLRDAVRELHAAALGTVQAGRRHDPDGTDDGGPIAEEVAAEVESLLHATARAAPDMGSAMLRAALGLNGAAFVLRAVQAERDALAQAGV